MVRAVLSSDLPTVTKLVAVIIADRCNTANGTCYPSTKTIAKEAGTTERNVRKHLAWLRDQGWISVVGQSKYGTNIYTIHPGRAVCGDRSNALPLSVGTAPPLSVGTAPPLSVGTARSEEVGSEVRVREPEEGVDQAAPDDPHSFRLNGTPIAPLVPEAKIVAQYNDICVHLPGIKVMTAKRKRELRARWKQHPKLDWWIGYFRYVNDKCPFLNGNNDRQWCANFDFLLRESAMAKILEGSYEP
jgi:hypothetical protein